jgi:hypothetical protein
MTKTAYEIEMRAVLCWMEMENQAAARETAMGGWHTDHAEAMRQHQHHLDNLLIEYQRCEFP